MALRAAPLRKLSLLMNKRQTALVRDPGSWRSGRHNWVTPGCFERAGYLGHYHPIIRSNCSAAVAEMARSNSALMLNE